MFRGYRCIFTAVISEFNSIKILQFGELSTQQITPLAALGMKDAHDDRCPVAHSCNLHVHHLLKVASPSLNHGAMSKPKLQKPRVAAYTE